MKTLAPASEIDEIQIAAKTMQTAFPNEECQILAQAGGVDYQSLVSCLDSYFYDVWSPANGIKKLSQKPEAWLCELQADLQKSFFVRYPQYAELEIAINPENTPELSRRIVAVDMLRQKLIIYLSELL